MNAKKELAVNLPEANPVYDAKALCEEFARLKGYTLKLLSADRRFGRIYFVRIRYGKYCLKYFDGPWALARSDAYEGMAEWLCDPDRWFIPGNFRGWSHFGKCSCVEELAMRMAIYGSS